MRSSFLLRKILLSTLLLIISSGTFAVAQETYRVWATQYAANHDFEVALPHVSLKRAGQYSLTNAYWVRIRRPGQNISINAPVREVGPWNERDNYWDLQRDIYTYLREYWWKDGKINNRRPRFPLPPNWRDEDFPVDATHPDISPLGIGIPEAWQAYNTSNPYTSSSYNYGCDQFGRHRWFPQARLNGAGIDFSNGVRRALGLGYLENTWVDVTFFSEPPKIEQVILTQDTKTIYDSQAGISIPAKAGLLSFKIIFNETMNPQSLPIVTFGLNPPYTANSVISIKWSRTIYENDTWEGIFTIPEGKSNQYDGTNTIRIIAKNLGNFEIDSDEVTPPYNPGPNTQHIFLIDTTSPDVKNADIVLVIDRSGSMGDENKMEAAKSAAKFFVDFMEQGDKIGVVSFSHNVRVDFPLTSIGPGTTVFSDNMESGQGNWTAEGSWTLITSDYHSPTHSWTDSPSGNYPNNANFSLTSKSINIPEGASLIFWHKYDLEKGYDYGKVEISVDGGTSWTSLNNYTGYQNSWTKASIALRDYANKTIKIRFRLKTDSSISRDGWYIDDVEIKTGVGKEQAKAAIDKLYASGRTSIGGGLKKGQEELDNRGSPDHPWAIVLLSDGLENTPPWVSNVLPDIEKKKTNVYAIAFGSDADPFLMQTIANRTGGKYYFSPTPKEIQAVYNDIKKVIKREEGIITRFAVIQKGETKIEKVNIDPSIKEATFGVDWLGSTLTLTLTTPQGIVITPGSATPGSGITFISGPTYNYYTIESPISGEWQLNIKAIDVPQGGEEYTVRVSGQTNLTLNTYFHKEEYQTGQAIGILATLSDEQGPITGATIEVIVQAPQQKLSQWKEIRGDKVPTIPLREKISTIKSKALKSQSKEVFFLYDDGLHQDGEANDGVYGNIYANTTNDGTYIFNFQASGRSSLGYTFTREDQTSLFVKQATQIGSISGTIFYGGTQRGIIYIQAWQNDPTLYGSPDYIGSVTTPGSYTLSNLVENTYFLSAYMDTNNNRIKDTDEPYGVYGEPIGVIVKAGRETSGINITLKREIKEEFSKASVYNYPNPFNPNRETTKIRFSLEKPAKVKIEIFTIDGDLVWSKELNAGVGETLVPWDGKNEKGKIVANGTYLLRVKANGKSVVKKIVVLR